MAPSEELELWIYEYAEMTGQAKWRDARILPFSTGKHMSPLVFVDAFRHLHAEGYIELRRWQGNNLVLFDPSDSDFFNYGFQVRVTFTGRKYFESLEARRVKAIPTRAVSTSKTQSAESENADSPRAFVSHSTQDREFVKKLATDLMANGVNAWYSEWEIKPGDSIREKIDAGLRDCEYFIIVLSNSSINRPWVRGELDAATVAKINGRVRKIIPIKIEDCGELPPTLASLCWEDFTSQSYESALQRVIDSIFDIDVRPPLGKR